MWSSDLILIEFAIILIGRGLGTFGLFGLLKLCGYENNKKDKITLKELLFIWYAGLIRGAIAFGLVLRIDKSVPNRDVIVTTSLTLVVVSTVFFGSTVGVLGKCLFAKEKEAEQEELEENKAEESDDVSYDLSQISNKDEQLHEPLVHYNDQVQSSDDDHEDEIQGKVKKKYRKGCALYVKRLDELIIRPIFIYKYEKDKEARARDFYELFQQDGIEKMFNIARQEEQRKHNRLSNGSVGGGSSSRGTALLSAMKKT